MKFSIVIPSWFTDSMHGKYGQHETFTFAMLCMERLLATINEEREKFEIIIIDNGSTLYSILDRGACAFETQAPVEAYWSFADILIRNKTNLGFAPACNQGFKLATGEWFICMNNDILIYPGWYQAMEESFLEIEKQIETGEFNDMDQEKNIGVLMPALMKEAKDAREALKIERPDLKRNFDKYGAGAEFGSMWMARKSFLDQIVDFDGYLYDEKFKIGMGEDRDLWDRVRMNKKDTFRTHKLRVYHMGNATIGKIKGVKAITTKNREYLAEKRAKRI